MKFELSIFKKSAASVGEHLAAVRLERQAVQREHDTVSKAPATREDVKAMVKDWAEAKAATYLKRLSFNMQEFITNPAASLRNPLAIENRMSMFGKSRQLGEYAMFPGPELEDEAICYLLGPAVVTSLHAAIDAMPWPAGALPLDGRERRLNDLKAKIADLAQQEESLVTEVRRALEI